MASSHHPTVTEQISPYSTLLFCAKLKKLTKKKKEKGEGSNQSQFTYFGSTYPSSTTTIQPNRIQAHATTKMCEGENK